MFKKNNPGCPCCDCDECLQWNDLLASGMSIYTEVSGTWEIASQRLRTDDDNAVLTYNETPVDTQRYLLFVVSRDSRNYDDERRTYFCYEDANNHLFAAVTLTKRGDLGLTVVQVNIKLYSVIGGAKTELGSSFSYTVIMGGSSDSALCSVEVQLYICVGPGTAANTLDVSVFVLATRDAIDATVSSTTLGSEIGLGNSTATTPHVNTYTGWSSSRLYYSNAYCGYCASRLCNEIPAQIEVELIGVRDRACSCELLTSGVVFTLDLVRPLPLDYTRWEYSETITGCALYNTDLRIRVTLERILRDQVFAQTGYSLAIEVDVVYTDFGTAGDGMSYAANIDYTECKRLNCYDVLTGIDVELTDDAAATDCYWTQQDSPLIKCRAEVNAVVPP